MSSLPQSSTQSGRSERGRAASRLVGQMRAPLSRVDLAASQMAREATTPSAVALAERIAEAVQDLDGMLGNLGALFGTDARGSGRVEDLRPVLDAVRARFGPILAARGIDWSRGDALGGDVRGDPDATRALAVGLLRAGSALLGGGGSLELDLIPEGERVGLVLRASGAAADGDSSGPSPDAVSRLADLRLRAFACGASVEILGETGCAGAAVWLPCEAEPCRAS